MFGPSLAQQKIQNGLTLAQYISQYDVTSRSRKSPSSKEFSTVLEFLTVGKFDPYQENMLFNPKHKGFRLFLEGQVD